MEKSEYIIKNDQNKYFVTMQNGEPLWSSWMQEAEIFPDLESANDMQTKSGGTVSVFVDTTQVKMPTIANIEASRKDFNLQARIAFRYLEETGKPEDDPIKIKALNAAKAMKDDGLDLEMIAEMNAADFILKVESYLKP